MTATNDKRKTQLRRWAVPTSLALAAALLLPATVSVAEAHSNKDQRYRDDGRRGYAYEYDDRRHRRPGYRQRDYHYRGYERPGRRHGHYRRHYRPARVPFYRRHHQPVRVYLSVPYVVIHGPRIDARVVYYPGDVPIYEPGYCPSDVHYHPYDRDHYGSGVRGSVDIRIGARF